MYRLLGNSAKKALKSWKIGENERFSLCRMLQTPANTVENLLPSKADFPSRHIGPRDHDIVTMLDLLGFKVSICFIINLRELQNINL